MLDRWSQREQACCSQVMRLPLRMYANGALQHMNRDGAVGVMLLHVGCALHGDEHSAEVIALVKGLGVESRLPGLFLLRVRDFVRKVERSKAVCRRYWHEVLPPCSPF